MKPSQPRSTPMLDCTGRLGNLGVSIALEEEGTLLARGGHGTVNCRLSEAPKSRAYHGGTKGSNPACSSGESYKNPILELPKGLRPGAAPAASPSKRRCGATS